MLLAAEEGEQLFAF